MTKFIALSNLSSEERQQIYCSVEVCIEKLVGSYDDLPLFEVQPAFRLRYRNLLDFAKDIFAQVQNKRETLLALIILFQAENNNGGDLVPAIRRASQVVRANLFALPHATAPLSVHLGDARLAHQRLSKTVDLVITSPPYINVFNYHQNYRAILEILGFDLLKVAESEIGSNRKNRSNRFRTVVQYTLDMEQVLVSLAQALKDRGLLVLVVGRESRVRGIPFCNSGILRETATALGCYRQESANERVFTNRFGEKIKEDILIFRHTGYSPAPGNARAIAGDHLRASLSIATGDVRDDVAAALSALNDIESSPLFDRKGII
jgi:hypothetical protein